MSEERRRNLMGGKSGGIVYGNFGGYMFTPGPLVYENGHFWVQEKWNEVNSHGSEYGLTNGSTYFTFVDIGQRFDSRGSSFTNQSGSINNANPLSFDGYDDWVVPTQNVLKTLIGLNAYYSIARNGSTVNGNPNKHFSKITTTISYAGASNIGGFLFFPDDKEITGKTLSAFDSRTESASDVSESELNNYIKQGCIFMPLSEYVYHNRWGRDYIDGRYWSATSAEGGDSERAYNLRAYIYDSKGLDPTDKATKTANYFPVILCRNAS